MKSLFAFPLFFLFACTATRLTSSWTAPTAGANDYKKILVVSLIQAEDSVLRQSMESQMAADLTAIGYNTVAFHRRFNAADMQYMRYDSVRQLLAAQGIDGVLTINLMAKEQEKIYVKDRGNAGSENSPLGSFWETPATPIRQSAGRPGYYVTSTGYYWESNFYDVGSITLLYNARSTATDVTSAHNLAHKYGKLIVADQQKNYVLTAMK